MSDPVTAPRAAGREPERALSAGGRTVRLLPRAPYEAGYVPRRGVVGFAFEAQCGAHAFGGDRRVPFRTRPNTLAWVPPGCDVWSRSDAGGEYLTVSTPVRVDAPSRRWSDRPHREAARAALALRAGLLSDDLDAGEALAHVEAMERATLAPTNGEPVEDAAARWLTDARLRRIEEFLDAHASDRVRVADLAAACGVSPGFLTRVCRAATGLTPHAWLLDRRLARARALLAGTDASVAEIALATGFATHAHLTATMRRRVGVVPSRLRAGGSGLGARYAARSARDAVRRSSDAAEPVPEARR